MIRNLKALGLASLAVFAMGAMAASAAQAQDHDAQLTLAEGEAGIVGTQTEEHVFTRQGRPVTCETAEFSGEASNGATTVKLYPTYHGCHVIVLGSTRSATVTPNSCYYLFHFTKHTEPTGYTADADLTCTEPGDQIEIHVYSGATHEPSDSSICTYTVPEQHGLKTIDVTNKEGEPDYIEADINISGIESHAHGISTLLCGSTEDAGGTLKGTATLKGEVGGEGVGATVSTDVTHEETTAE